MASQLTRELNEVDQINSSIHGESNQLAVHTDRLSRLMSRQYFAIQHSERVTESQSEGFKYLLSYGNKILGRTRSLRASWEDQYRSMLMHVPESHGHRDSNVVSLSQRVEFCQANLDIIRGKDLTLQLAKDPDTSGTQNDRDDEDALSVEGSADQGSSDDFAMDTNLEKAS